MRKKTLAAFAAVYAVICLTYGAINGSLSAAPDITEDSSASESIVQQTETAAAETTAPEAAAGQTTTSAEQPEPETVTTTTATEQTEAPEETPEETVTEQTETEEQEQQIEEYTEAPAVPSLEEYLSRLRCGGCHHGCYLLNPRCMRGARKQSQAENEYYSLYG